MPKIFSKNAKFNVIEYGSHICPKQDFISMRNKFTAFFKNLFS